MTLRLVERIADALLFEGYMLYPYRPSAVKNRQRFNFGVVQPDGIDCGQSVGDESPFMVTECLVEGSARSTLDVKVRFLQLVQRTIGRLTTPTTDPGAVCADEYVAVDVLDLGDRLLQPWQEAVEGAVLARGMSLGDLLTSVRRVPIVLPASEQLDPVHDTNGFAVGVIARRQARICAELEISAIEVTPGVFRIRARVANMTSPVELRDLGRDEILLHSLVSVHTILSVSGGTFVSLLDPPAVHREAAAACHGMRSWPVLVGEPGQRDTMLASPIILYDYPIIAPESAGDLFDGTEIDEILSLRILTMTDEEKREMRQSDERARLLLERTESLGADQFMRMHGALR